MKIVVETGRLKKTTTVDELIGMQEGELKTIVGVLSRFVVGEDGRTLAPEEGRRALGGLTIEELEGLAQEFQKKAEEAAVPPG